MPRPRKGRAPQGKYAQIPVELSKTVLADLSATEFRVWFALCMQCQHWSNGTGMLCRSVIREFHLGSQRDVTAATRRLLETKRVIRTREAVQRKSALFGVTHLALNADALAKAGLSDVDIRIALKRFSDARSDSNSGSASSNSTVEAQSDEIDISGSANPPKQALALPKSRTSASKSTLQRYHPGTRLKNLPFPSPNPQSASEVMRTPSPAPSRASSGRIAGATPAEIVRELISTGWSDAQVHDFACKQKLSITLDEIRAISARPHA